MIKRVPAEVFPPGEYIKDELEARGWTQADLAEILGRPPKLVSDIIAGKGSISPETAQGLGDAFATGAQIWMNLDSAYRLWRLRPNDDVARRARIYQMGPLKEMTRRNWIEASDNLAVLEKRVSDFYGLRSIEETPVFPHAARKPTPYSQASPAQLAWLFRARALARGVSVGTFSEGSLSSAFALLKPLLQNVEEIRYVPRVLADAGIRYVIVEALAGTKIDGACFWLSDNKPVIAMSIRYDRVDWFWHTLLHELDHVKNRDGFLDVSLVGKDAIPYADKPEEEKRADRFAANCSIPSDRMEPFIARVKPLFAKIRILGFAATLEVHPGIVVGQLQYRKEITYAHSRDLLVRVKEYITATALTDGWGSPAPAGL